MRKIAAAALLALASCGGSAGAGDANVSIEHVAFQPARLEIARGTTVTWKNLDAEVTHTATSGMAGDKGVPGLDNGTPPRPDGTFDGSMEDAGATFSFTFDEPGTFPYFCRVHQSMTGEIVVE